MVRDGVHIYEQQSPVKSAARLLDLLEMLSVAQVPMGVSEISRRLGIPKSSAHMLIVTLEGRGYVVGDGHRCFRLSAVLGRRGREWVGGETAALLDIAKPVMHKLAHATGESVFIGTRRDEHTLEYLYKVVSRHEIRCDGELGEPRWLHSTSVGLVILAFQDPGALEKYFGNSDLVRLTEQTPRDKKKLRELLAEVRKQGYAVTHDTNAVGASGIAAPIYSNSGRIWALNLAAPTSRFDRLLGKHKDLLIKSAGQISADMIGPQQP